MKLHIFGLLILLLSTAVFGEPIDSVWIEGHPLQVKLDRLYLDQGLESRVFPGCHFVVHLGPDSIFAGCIESSYPGVSVSYPTNHFFDALPLVDLHVWVERAPFDTGSPILLGHVGYLPLRPAGDSPDPDDSNHVIIREYPSQFEAALAFEQNAVSGLFSYRHYSSGNTSAVTAARPAPFFVALVPNPARAITRRGILTTSLYYRLDQQRLPICFDGDSLVPFNRCCLRGDSAQRPYPYSPGQGRALLNSLPDKPRNVTIGVEHTVFEPAARYFADILARDRFHASMSQSVVNADVRLIAVPLGETELASLRYLHSYLASDTIANSGANQAIRIIGGYLDSAESAADSSAAEYYQRLAESSLRDDIGVFALFRPVLYFTADRSLIGDVFQPGGQVDLSRLARIRLPQNREECRP